MSFNPIVIEKGLNADFARKMGDFQAARQINPGLMALAMQIPSTGAYEKLGWLGSVPGVQEWISEKSAKALADYDYTIRNRDWFTAARINENDVNDDQVGALNSTSAWLVKRLLAHPEKLLVDLILAGTSGLAYDGIAFFSNASGVRTIDNLIGGGNTDTLAHIEKELSDALIAMAKFVDDQGEILNIKGDLILCPIALENKMKKIVMSSTDATATTDGIYNPYATGYQVIGDARLDASDANSFYVFATREIVKPFVYTMRQAAKPSFEKKNLTKDWIYSADYRGNIGYGLPHLGVKVVNT
jgi:phage major head subunit gpT-like protein